MEITKEILDSIFTRANQFAITKWGKEPDQIRIESNATIRAIWIDYWGGEATETDEVIEFSDLTADLEVVAAERIKREEEEAERMRKVREQERIEKEKRDKEQRRAQWLQLKKEFES